MGESKLISTLVVSQKGIHYMDNALFHTMAAWVKYTFSSIKPTAEMYTRYILKYFGKNAVYEEC